MQAVTAFDDDKGRTHLLVINEALYFGQSMDHSLINPNRIRMFGYKVNDDPFNHDRPFGIDHPDVFVPFDTEGTTIFFNS